MRKRIFSILCAVIASVCILAGFSTIETPAVHAYQSLTESEIYEQTIREINDLTYYEIISICKSSESLDEAITVQDNNGEIIINYDYSWLVDEINAISYNNLTKDRLIDICDKYDYSVRDKKDFYELYSNYCLKSLIVTGELNGETYGAIKIASYLGTNTLLFASEQQTKLVYNQLKNAPNLSVEINYLVWLSDTEVEPVVDEISTQASSNYSFDGHTYMSWGAEAMEVNYYREYLKNIPTDREVVVAVLDTGINTNHEIFKGRLLTSGGSVVGTSYYTSTYTYSGYAFEDDMGHGSHVSGTICDLTPSNVKILPIKVLGENGNGDYAKIVAGMNKVVEYASTYNIVCCNMSLGGETNGTSPTSVINAVNAMLAKNILTVVASGNETDDSANHYPGCIDDVITVANVGLGISKFADANGVIKYSYSVDKNGNIVDYYWNNTFPTGNTTYYRYYSSNYGDEVDISAPGTFIKSAIIESSNATASSIKSNGGYSTITDELSGTSMAAPHVSAVVAMICLDSAYYDENEQATYTADVIETRLKDMATRKQTNDSLTLNRNTTTSYTWTQCFGVGLANVRYYTNIMYTATDTTVTYDANYHNISVTDVKSSEGATITYSIAYGFTSSSCTITNISSNSNFKNTTGTSGKTIYFKISNDALGSVVGHAKLIILPRAITISFNSSGYYGNAPTVSSYTITSNGLGEKPTITLSGITSSSSVGVYTTSDGLSATTTNSNYTITLASGCKYTIQARPITIKINDVSIEYGTIPTSHNGYTVTSGSLVNGDVLTVNVALPTTIKSVGTYTLTATASNTNYNITVTNGTLTVTQKVISATLQNQTGIYGDTVSLDATKYTVTSSVDVSSLGTIQITTTATSKSSVGKYALSMTCSSGNYTISVTNTAYYIITARRLQITATNQSGIYGVTPSLSSSKYSITPDTSDASEGLVNSDSVTITLYTDATSKSSVGSYPITATTTNANYYISVKSGNYIVNARPVTIQLANNYGTYGDNPSFNKEYTVTNAGYSILSGDSLGLSCSTTASKTSSVGEYTLTGTASNSNYNVTVLSGKYIVQQRGVSITLQNQSGEYGDTVTVNQSSYSVSGLASFDSKTNLGVTLSTTATSKSLGDYDITATISNTNYTISNTPSGKFSITPRTITIKIDDQSGYYGATPSLKAEYTVTSTKGVISGDTLGLSVSASTLTNTSGAGTTHKIKGSISNANYSATINQGTYTVLAKPITISLQNQSGEYGEAISLDNSKYSAPSGAVVNGDNLNIVLQTTATSTSIPNDYDITVKSNNSNYSITNNPTAKYTITKRKITITAKNCGGEYNCEPNIPADNYTLSKSIVNSDNLNITLSTTATSDSPRGTYPITVTASHEYYTLAFVSGVYTIGQRTLKVTILKQTGVYGDVHSLDSSMYTVPSGVIKDGDIVNITLNFTTTLTIQSPVGNYNIVASTTNGNYAVETISGENKYTITAKTITLDIDEQTGTYGAVNIDSTKFSVTTGLVGTDTKDDLGVTLSTTATSKSGANKTYNITATCTNSNYKLNYNGNNKYRVVPKDIVINVSSQSGSYGNTPSLSAGYSADSGVILSGDKLDLKLGTNADSTSKIGTYDIYIISNNTNYNITNCNGTGKYEVKPRAVTIKIYQYFNIGDDIIFDTTSEGYSVISGSVVNNDDLQLTITASKTSRDEAGEYSDVTVTSSNTNYTVTISSAMYKISTKQIVVTVLGSMIYGNHPSTAQYTYKVVEGKITTGDDVGFTFQTSATSTSSVGKSYTITETHTDENYTVSLRDCVFEVTPRTLTIFVENQSGQYGTTHSVSSSYTTQHGDIVNDDKVTITLSFDGSTNIRTPVGNYDIIGKSSNKNYEVKVASGSYEITEREVELTISNKAGKYGDEISLDDVKCTVKNILSGDELNIKLKTNATSTSQVGDYDIMLDSFSNNNYSISKTTNGVFTINPRSVTVKVSPTGIYGNTITLSDGVYSVSDVELIGEDTLNLVLSTSATATDNIGSYPVSVLSCNPNYSVDLGDSVFTIVARTITILLKDQYGVYGDVISLKNDSSVYTATGVLDRDIDNLQLEFSTNAVKSSPAGGDYKISAVCGNTNYNATITSAKYIISARPIEITPNNVNSVYGEAVSIKHSNYKITNGDKLSGDDLKITLVVDFGDYSVNTYQIDAESGNSNYALTVKKGVWTIEPREVSIKVVAVGVYGTVDLSNYTYEIVQGSVISGDDLDLELQTIANNLSPVNTYELTATSKNSNYEVVVTSGKYIVNRRPVNITLQPQSSVYGEAVNVNQGAYSLDDTQIINGDSLNVELFVTAKTNSPANEYDIYVRFDNANYEPNISPAKYTITKRELRVLVEGAIQYGDSLDLTDPQYITITDGSIINDDKLNLVVHCNAQNTYTLGEFDIEFVSCNPNYSVTLEDNSKINIGAKKLVISIEQVYTYGEQIILNQKGYTLDKAVIGNDDLGVILTTSVNNTTPVGLYDINISHTNTNYELQINSSVVKITPRPITVIVSNAGGIYGDNVSLAEVSHTIKTGEIVNNDQLNIYYITTAMDDSNAGEYTIDAVTDNENYSLNSISGVYTIGKRKLKVKLNDQTTYRGIMFKVEQTGYEVVDGEVVGDDDIGVKQKTNAKRFNFAGTYKLYGECVNDNYEIEFENAELTLKVSFFDYTYIGILIIVCIIIFRVIKKSKRQKRKAKEELAKWDDIINW